MSEKLFLWIVVLFFALLEGLGIGYMAKELMGPSSQAIRPAVHCDWLPGSLSCGGGSDWRETLQDPSWPES